MTSIRVRLFVTAITLIAAIVGCTQSVAPLPTPTLAPSSPSQITDTKSAPSPDPTVALSVSDSVKSGGNVRVGLAQEPAILNPIFSSQTVAIIVASTIMEGLLTPA